jgi:uncharacterized protein (TIGR00106 family)
MALAEISIIPLGTATASIGDWIAQAITVLEKEGMKYEISPMGTLIEAEISDVFRVASRMHKPAFGMGTTRVVTTVTIDDRRDKSVTMKSKVASVKKRL